MVKEVEENKERRWRGDNNSWLTNFISSNSVWIIGIIFLSGMLYFNINSMGDRLTTLENAVSNNEKDRFSKNETLIRVDTQLSYIKNDISEIKNDLKSLIRQNNSNSSKEVAYYNASK